MKFNLLKTIALFCICAAAAMTTSCTVDQDAGFFTKTAKTGDSSNTKKKTATANLDEKSSSKKDDEVSDWATRMKEAKAKREEEAKAKEAKQATAKKKEDKEKARKEARELAENKKADRAREKDLAEKKKLQEQEQERKLELAEKEKSDKEREAKKLKARELAEKNRKEKESRKLAAKKLAEEKRKARELASASSDGRRSSGSGFSGFFATLSNSSSSSKYKSDGHYIYVNQRLLSGLSASNAKIEIDLSDQRVRVYKTGGRHQLVIESSVSSGKSGYGTSTGTFRIKEKKVEKRSTLYGSWKNSSGDTIPSNGEVGSPPSGASTFVGASMPYWMRINGGIGMHIGYVPNYPASHGCIRIPSAIQPLIFSKVGVGTSVTVTR